MAVAMADAYIEVGTPIGNGDSGITNARCYCGDGDASVADKSKHQELNWNSLIYM